MRPSSGTCARWAKHCPTVRLLFAGRFDLKERVPEHKSFFEAAPRLPLVPFTVDERKRYLTGVRAFDDDALVDTIAERSDGSPFKLALIADIVADGDVTSDDLAAYDRVDLMYLLERVLLRINDMDVRWALRYAAILRMVDFEALERVVMPVLVREMPRHVVDDTALGLPSHAVGTWRHQQPRAANLLWPALGHFVDTASWVTAVGEGSDRILSFHLDVRAPMRRLMREQPEILAELHERAAEHFRERARDERAQWSRWTRAELYHRIARDPGTGAQAVRERLRQAASLFSDSDRRALVDDLLSAEYAVLALLGEVDDDAVPGDTRPPIPADLAVELVHLDALLQLEPIRRGADGAWEACRLALVRLDTLRDRARASIDDERMVAIRAAVDLYAPETPDGHRATVRAAWSSRLRAATPAIDDPGERMHALLLRADLVSTADADEATRCLREALVIVETHNAFVVTRLAVVHRLAEHLFRAGDLVAAFREIEHARKWIRRRSRDEERLALQETKLMTHAGRGAEVIERADRAAALSTLGGTPRDELTRLQMRSMLATGRAALASRQPWRAIDALLALGPTAELAVARKEFADWLPADVGALRTSAFAAAGDAGLALAELDAADEWALRSAGNAPARRLLATRLEVELRVLRDFRRAEVTLQRVESLASGGEDYPALLLALAKVEWLAARGDATDARDELGVVLERLRRDGAPPGQHVRARLEGLALGDPETVELHVAALTEALGAIRPKTARLASLRELARADRLPAEAPATAALRRLAGATVLRGSRDTLRHSLDRHVAAIVASDVERVAAGDRAAVEVLPSRIPDREWRLAADWVEAAARAGLAGGSEQRAMTLCRRLAKHNPASPCQRPSPSPGHAPTRVASGTSFSRRRSRSHVSPTPAWGPATRPRWPSWTPAAPSGSGTSRPHGGDRGRRACTSGWATTSLRPACGAASNVTPAAASCRSRPRTCPRDCVPRSRRRGRTTRSRSSSAAS